MPPARLREPIVPAKVKAAFDYIYTTPGATQQSAAAHVGLTVYKLRYLMGLPQSVRWMCAHHQPQTAHAQLGRVDHDRVNPPQLKNNHRRSAKDIDLADRV